MLSVSVVDKILSEAFTATDISALSVQFRNPIFVGDILTIEV
mgnify:CR=1 FL=1